MHLILLIAVFFNCSRLFISNISKEESDVCDFARTKKKSNSPHDAAFTRGSSHDIHPSLVGNLCILSASFMISV